MDLSEYLEWRQAFLLGPVGRPLNTPRGKCIVGKSFTLDWTVRPNWHLRNRELEEAEFNLIYYGKDMSPEWKEKLYGDDDELYEAYKTLHVGSLINNGKRRMSRKNIVFNKDCCLCYWQLHGDTLTVISRSLDVQRAGISDLVIINRAAKLLDCKDVHLVTLCNHVYKNRDTIARRTNENPGL